VYSRAYLSRIGAPVVALCSMAVATGVNTREFRGADTANHDQYTGFDRFAEPMASPDVLAMSLKARVGLPTDEPDPASATPIERIRKVE
jgi:hypothetical protein